MTAELIEVIRFTAFAIVIALVIGLGTVKAASITEKDYPRRTREAAVREGASAQSRGTEARQVDASREEPTYGANPLIVDSAHVGRSRTEGTS
jgi:hypothetical protein